MTKTVYILPPEVKQFFDKHLLSKPWPTFGDTLETFWSIYLYISRNLMRKACYNNSRYENAIKLEQEFLKLYEQAAAKEKYLEAKTSNKAQRPFTYVTGFGKGNETIFRKLKQRSYGYAQKYGQ